MNCLALRALLGAATSLVATIGASLKWNSTFDKRRGATCEFAPEALSRRGLTIASASALVVGPKSSKAEDAVPDLSAAQQAALEDAASRLSLGAVAEDVVLPAWFVGEWACVGEIYKVELPAEKDLTVILPGVPKGIAASNDAVGMEEGEFLGRRRWVATKRQAPRTSSAATPGQGGALEDRAGLAAGVVAAAQALAGPAPKISPVDSSEPTWTVSASASDRGRWRLRAAGALAQQDPEVPGAFRVSELFDVQPETNSQQDGTASPAVRVVTIWRRSPVKGNEEAQTALRGLGKPDSARDYLLQAVQLVYILPNQLTSSENCLASVTSRFLYSPVVSSN